MKDNNERNYSHGAINSVARLASTKRSTKTTTRGKPRKPPHVNGMLGAMKSCATFVVCILAQVCLALSHSCILTCLIA